MQIICLEAPAQSPFLRAVAHLRITALCMISDPNFIHIVQNPVYISKILVNAFIKFSIELAVIAFGHGFCEA